MNQSNKSPTFYLTTCFHFSVADVIQPALIVGTTETVLFLHFIKGE